MAIPYAAWQPPPACEVARIDIRPATPFAVPSRAVAALRQDAFGNLRRMSALASTRARCGARAVYADQTVEALESLGDVDNLRLRHRPHRRRQERSGRDRRPCRRADTSIAEQRRNAIADGLNQTKHVRRQERSSCHPGAVGDQPKQVLCRLRIVPVGGLIEDQHLGLLDEQLGRCPSRWRMPCENVPARRSAACDKPTRPAPRRSGLPPPRWNPGKPGRIAQILAPGHRFIEADGSLAGNQPFA